MRSERFDACRRELLSDLHALLNAAALDAEPRERVEAGLVAVLDELLMRLTGYSAERNRAASAAAAEFCLLACWPAWLHHHGAALLDERSALRWQATLDARHRGRGIMSNTMNEA